jgi:beta-mannanase
VAELGHAPGILDGFYYWSDPFPSSWVSSVLALGSTPMITWLPEKGRGSRARGYTLNDITSGKADSYLTQWADAAKAVNHTILVRLMHEMNGNWYPWGAGSNTPAEYVAAFQHVVDVVRQAGATNLQFVWCVAGSAASNLGITSSVPISQFFPGDSYVSWVAMDAYSRSADDPKSFDQLVQPVYPQLVALSSRPVMVVETAMVPPPGQPDAKAQWIQQGFSSVPVMFPRLRAVFYFDSRGNGSDFPFDGDAMAVDAMRQVATSPTWEAKVPSATLAY